MSKNEEITALSCRVVREKKILGYNPKYAIIAPNLGAIYRGTHIMANSAIPAIKPRDPISLSAASAITDVEPKKIRRFIHDRVLPGNAYLKAGKKKSNSVRVFALPVISFYSTESGAALNKDMKKTIAYWLADAMIASWDDFFTGNRKNIYSKFKFEKDVMTIHLSGAVRDSMDNLRNLMLAEKRIVRDPEIRGGIPTIKGTRISPYEVSGFTDADNLPIFLKKHYPSLTPEDVILSSLYVKAYPPLGRPPKEHDAWKKKWKLVSSRSVPLNLDSV